MSIAIETLKTQNTLVIWNVGLPPANSSVVSTPFTAYGIKWNLKLNKSYERTNYNFNLYDVKEVWDMSLYYSGNKVSPLFPVKVYIRSGGKDIYLSQKEIVSTNTVIWHCISNDFKTKYPNIEIVGTTLQFVLDLNLAIPDPSPLKENNLPCLENLSLDLRRLVDDGSDPDVQLKCGEFSMGAHKLILGARSEVFRNMMKSGMKEVREDSIEIIDLEPKILEVFIRYIYTGILPELAENTALPLYEAADKYQVEALKKRCAKFLAQNASQENALRILATADAHCDTDLKGSLISYIVLKKVPSRETEWLEFCNEYPRLANEVLNSYYKISNSCQKLS